MILIDIDSLSDTELRYIAQQEGFEDWETIDREDLIEQLQEKYDDSDIDFSSVIASAMNQKRFCTSLTDFTSKSNSSDFLPGVENLPPSYNETSIHLLLRDPQWAYAYWSLSPCTKAQFFEGKVQTGEVFLRVNMVDQHDNSRSFFDICVGLDDEQWNINLPQMGCKYDVTLCFKDGQGVMGSLAQSNVVETFHSYWENHYDEIAMDRALFYVHFSSVVTKEGEVANNPVLKNIAKILSEGVLE
ncbi:MAG: DUF4912 domain-containing protein [Sphaerochaetaceae bacterium]